MNNLDERRVKLERSLRTLLDKTKMGPYYDQQMAFLSTLKPVASSYDNVGTREPPRNKTSQYCQLQLFLVSLEFKEKIM